MINQEQIINTRKYIGAYLKQARESQNISHYAIRKSTGLEILVQKNLESGLKGVNMDTFYKYCIAINYPFLFILPDPANYDEVKDQLLELNDHGNNVSI